MGSNHGPKRYQHFALPTELLSPKKVGPTGIEPVTYRLQCDALSIEL